MNFGSIFGGFARVLPGYVQGQRQAVQDNWTDLMNYNKTQMGQLENAFTEATFGPRLDMFHNAVRNDDINTMMNGLNFGRFMVRYPADLQSDFTYQWMYPQIAPLQMRAMAQMWGNPQMMMGGGMSLPVGNAQGGLPSSMMR
ncbi:MAG: hypothetical protein HDQ88_05680 [Clostridia bacterium]|nr:hypothetical protein [Clostridia bacterium]